MAFRRLYRDKVQYMSRALDKHGREELTTFFLSHQRTYFLKSAVLDNSRCAFQQVLSR